MQDTPPLRSSDQASTEASLWGKPSSSRMLTTYLTDIEQFLDEQRWEIALREALDLPQIAVALSDAGLRSSHERSLEWCREWIQSPAAANDSGADPERVCQAVAEHMQKSVATDKGAIPSTALRRLRLRRHARNAPRGFKAERAESGNERAAAVIEIATALVEGVRRWYAQSACRDANTQTNLARLAVLR